LLPLARGFISKPRLDILPDVACTFGRALEPF
jgi:hypothetical protein